MTIDFAKEYLQEECFDCHEYREEINQCLSESHCFEVKQMAIAALEQSRWIPFKTRSLTEEEKEEYPGWDSILDCELPDDGQRILVSIKYKNAEAVQMDEFYTDDGCYLDSGYEIGTEAMAWMPKPSPYKAESEGENK